MKKINIQCLWALMLLLAAWGCAEESNLEPEGQWELSSPTLVQVSNVVLNEETPNELVSIEWDKAYSSARYGVYYTVIIDSVDASDSSNPILELKSDESGKAAVVSLPYVDLNDALYMAGFDPNVEIPLVIKIEAACLSRTTYDEQELTVVRYDDDKLFMSGSATEVGDNVNTAIKFNRLKNGSGEKLKQYEVFTSLKAGESFKIYNGRSSKGIAYGLSEEGALERDGSALSVEEEGVYQISVDFEAKTIQYYKINRLGLIGDALTSGWDADEEISYQGMGVWQADISFVNAGSYIIRANDNWEGILKRVVETDNSVVAENFANANDIAIENFTIDEAGYYTVTLDLQADNYTIEMEKAPEERMYLIANGTDAYELTMVGDGVFATTSYIALQNTDEIIINTESDGSGMSYSIAELIGEGTGDKVEGSATASEATTPFSVAKDQAYGFRIDVNAGTLNWYYYNLKLFHWDDDADGGWDDKIEAEMTYVHPYTFTVTADLTADFESKFFSPWDIQFGAGANDDATALTGTMTNDGGSSNFKNIMASGSYTITIEIAADFATANYEFIQ